MVNKPYIKKTPHFQKETQTLDKRLEPLECCTALRLGWHATILFNTLTGSFNGQTCWIHIAKNYYSICWAQLYRLLLSCWLWGVHTFFKNVWKDLYCTESSNHRAEKSPVDYLVLLKLQASYSQSIPEIHAGQPLGQSTRKISYIKLI